MKTPALLTAFVVIAAWPLCGATAHDRDDLSPGGLRRFIDQQVGGIDKLKVPATDADIPLPRQPDGTVNPRYQTTEEKRFLGKLLFHDPVRTSRIDPAYGGVLATKQTGSCASCHLGEAAGKAGTVLNFSVGGEGRGYTDEAGNYIIRRRARTDLLPKLRAAPLFPGDALVDALPTLTDVYLEPPAPGVRTVQTPARQNKTPAALGLLATGRLDALDSVGRQSPNMIGFAFNNRLLLGGFAGEPNTDPSCTKVISPTVVDTRSCQGLNPNNDPAQENLTLLLLDAHRMLTTLPDGRAIGEAVELQKYPAFVKLFQEAFPAEAAKAAASRSLDDLVNDDTVLRATATFLRTAVTRNTPFDRFLAGDNGALTSQQLRGARLFFTPATNGAGGAGCFSCHSGPMFNKQHDDPDVAGIGEFVEENFYNVGIGDHPVQALNRAARNDPNFHDEGRKDITNKDDDAFKFRVVTLRQLKDARTFFHNGSFTKVRDVVAYFNAGIPQDPAAGAARTLSERFTHPRGNGYPRGLGLGAGQMNDLADFIENGLYDRAFVRHDPKSTTTTFQPNERDLTYSKYRPDLAALGAKDGFVISGLAMDNNDPLSRRDQGLETLDVTDRLDVELVDSDHEGAAQVDVYRITNKSASIVDTHLLIEAQSQSNGRIKMRNGSGIASNGDPYRRVFLADGVLLPGQSIVRKLVFERPPHDRPVTYALRFLSGQGNP
jgi:hypothetical protein